MTLEETFLNEEEWWGRGDRSAAVGQSGMIRTPSSEPVGGHGAETAWPALKGRQNTGDVAVGRFWTPEIEQLPPSTDYKPPRKQNLKEGQEVIALHLLRVRPEAKHLMNYKSMSYETEEEPIASVNLKCTNGKSETPGRKSSEYTVYIMPKAGKSIIRQIPSAYRAPAAVPGAGDNVISVAFTTLQQADSTLQSKGGEM